MKIPFSVATVEQYSLTKISDQRNCSVETLWSYSLTDETLTCVEVQAADN